MFSCELSHPGDSNEYTQYTIFNTKEKITLNFPISVAMGFFQGTQERVRNSVVNEPSVLETLSSTVLVYKNCWPATSFLSFINFNGIHAIVPNRGQLRKKIICTLSNNRLIFLGNAILQIISTLLLSALIYSMDTISGVGE